MASQPDEIVPRERNDTFESGTGLQAIREMVSHSDSIITELRNLSFDPNQEKKLRRTYTITQVADMVGRSQQGIRKAESFGQLPKPDTDERGRRVGYSLEDVNRIRTYFNATPGRLMDEEPVRLAIQNFKGGVGKSTICTHVAQFLAEKGYRILVIDCDSQASTTTTFGLRPDLELDTSDTLLPFFNLDESTLEYAIRKTYWDKLHIIPANLSLYTAEYELAASASHAGADWIERLHRGIQTIEAGYDVIVMDPPPALGMISLNVVRAANALIVPTPPAMYDYHSTVTFFRMMEEVLESVERAIGEPVNYKFLKILISKYDTNKSAQEYITKLMRHQYSRFIMNAGLKDSAEIDNAGADWKTVYELERHTTSAQTYKRCMSTLNAVCREIEQLIRATWPSHHEALEAEGVAVE